MAWEELLKLHDERGEALLSPEDDGNRDEGSLIGRVRALAGQTGGAEALPGGAAAPPDGETVPAFCADGYLRRSPVQAYRTAEGYERRRIRKLVLTILGLCAVAALTYALMRAGLLRLR